MTASGMNGTCHGCDAPLPPNKAPGRARKWCSERCRKLTLYSRPCVDCGAPCNLDGRVANPSMRCGSCNQQWTRACTRTWILDSIRDWNQRFGRPPAASDWNPRAARYNVDRRFARLASTGRPWPGVASVQEHFGSWSAGLRAAGFEPMKPNEYWIGREGVQLRDQDLETAA